jgi:hypothetical protein
MNQPNKEAAAPPFSITVGALQASDGLTYVVSLHRTDSEDPDDHITLINRHSVDEANEEGAAWAALLRVPFMRAEAVQDTSKALNTQAEYGDSIIKLTSKEVDLLLTVYRSPGSKYPEGTVVDGVPIYGRLEALGLIEPMGSWKWQATEKAQRWIHKAISGAAPQCSFQPTAAIMKMVDAYLDASVKARLYPPADGDRQRVATARSNLEAVIQKETTEDVPDTARVLVQSTAPAPQDFLDAGDAARVGETWITEIARRVGRLHGRLERYESLPGHEGADNHTTLLWDGPHLRAVCLIIRTQLNRSKLVRWEWPTRTST